MVIHCILLLFLLVAANPVQGQDPLIPRKTKQDSHQQKLASLKKTATNTLEPLLNELRLIDDLQQRVSLAQPLISLLSKSRPEACRRVLEMLLDDCIRLKNERTDAEKTEPDPDVLARKIVQISASFDRKLANLLVERYDQQTKLDQDQSSPSKESARTKFHLTVASQLVEENESLAVRVAEEVISNPVLPETVVFLSLMRRQNLAAANRLFTMALAGIRSRGGADANESLFLFSYVFSPQQVPIITPQGLGVYHFASGQLPLTAPNMTVAEQYLDSTSQLLLDPARYSRQNLQPVLGPVGDWFLIKFIETKATLYRPQLVDSLLAQRYVLEGRMENRSTEASSSLDRWNNSPGQNSNSGSKSDTVESLLKRAEQAANTKRRDQFLYRAAVAATQLEEYDRALKIADELSIEYRTEAKQFLSFGIAMAAIKKDDNERAARIEEKDDDLLRRAYVFTLIARSVIERKDPDSEQARFYLSAVEQLIPKLTTDAERVSAAAGVIEVYCRFDRAEAFRSLQELIRYANKTAGFAGDTSVSRMLDIGGFYFDYSLYDEFTLDQALRSLAVLNFDQTLEDVRHFESRTARLKATVAVCKSVLG